MVRGFDHALIMQDASGLDRAGVDRRQAIAALRAVASIPSLSAQRSGEAVRLASSVKQMLAGARSTYGAVMAGAMTPATQEEMRALPSRTGEAKAALPKREPLAADLHQQLSALEAHSPHQRWSALAVFAATLLVAGVVVHATIRRAITAPADRVIGSKQDATNALEQAACLEETSASLEERKSGHSAAPSPPPTATQGSPNMSPRSQDGQLPCAAFATRRRPAAPPPPATAPARQALR